MDNNLLRLLYITLTIRSVLIAISNLVCFYMPFEYVHM